jgi:transposase InsO family protein
MAALCREYGISPKTGYKFLARYESWGEAGMDDRSRRPKSSPVATSRELLEQILQARKQHPTWGPRKLRVLLVQSLPGVQIPSRATIANVLHRHQLTKPQRRRRGVPPYSAPLAHAQAPNDVWCIDFKGQFMLGDGSWCYPLTVTDAFSRYVLLCEAFSAIRSGWTLFALGHLFREKGVPAAIRSDNGEPFVSPRGLLGLSRMGVWFERLGIVHERIDPGCPQQNGRHERMHRTLKAETTRPAAQTLLGQQERFDIWRNCFNYERPHEALADRTPGSMYQPSPRSFDGETAKPQYPLHDRTLQVWQGGIVKIAPGHRFALTTALTSEWVGVREVDDGRWLVTFIKRDLGHYDERDRKFVPTTTLRKEDGATEKKVDQAAQ